MILLPNKKPITALKLLHSINHTQVGRCCYINKQHESLIKILNYTINEPIYNLEAGLYKIVIDGITFIIDMYFYLTDADHLIIRNANSIDVVVASNHYPIVPYKLLSVKDTASHYDLQDTVNDFIDAIMVVGNTQYTGSPSMNSPASINRIASINISTLSGENSNELKIPLKHTLGSLPNGVKDTVIINADQLIAHDIINTSKEVLSGGLDWQYKQDLSTDEYYVFFGKYDNVKLNNNSNSMRCSHFEVVSCSSLINKSTKKNCIASSYGSYGNGIFIKIASSILDIHGDKDFAQEMKKWILMQAISQNPIYIEYETSKPIYNTILIDEYHAKTWFPNTRISVEGNYGFSVFYKTLLRN